MVKKALGLALLILCVVVGAVAGDFVKNSKNGSSASEVSAMDKSAHKDKKGHDKKDKDSHDDKNQAKKKDKYSKSKKDDKVKSKGGHGGDKAMGGGPNYLKFKRQFVVPVTRDGMIEALVIMNINYELDDYAPDNAYSFEPKLRDAIMRELLSLSHQDVFGQDLTTAKSYESIRSSLLQAGRGVLSEGIKDVLILDIARQEQ